MIITILGNAGSGKSTIAKLLAKRLNFTHISMGDMRRAATNLLGISMYEFNVLGSQPGNEYKFDTEMMIIRKNCY